MRKELKQFIQEKKNVDYSKFYIKEFESTTGTIYYIHYFDGDAEVVSHETFIYSTAEARNKDFKIIQNKVVVSK